MTINMRRRRMPMPGTHIDQLAMARRADEQTSRRASSSWPLPQAQTTEAAHLISLWLSSPKSKNKTNQRTQKPKTEKNQHCDKRSKCERAGQQYTVKNIYVCLCLCAGVRVCVCVCVQSILDVCSLVDARASPKEMLHPAAVLARRHPTRGPTAHQGLTDAAHQPGPRCVHV